MILAGAYSGSVPSTDSRVKKSYDGLQMYSGRWTIRHRSGIIVPMALENVRP